MELMKTDIEHQVLIRVSREKVFNAMTTPEGLNSWFIKGTTKETGKLHLRWRDWGPDKVTVVSENCPILIDRKPIRFVFKWWIETNNPSTIEMDFFDHAEGTLIKLKESGYENSDEDHKRFEECAVDWGAVSTLLKFYCEHGITYRFLFVLFTKPFM